MRTLVSRAPHWAWRWAALVWRWAALAWRWAALAWRWAALAWRWAALAWHWAGAGMALGRHWHGAGPALAWRWAGAGPRWHGAGPRWHGAGPRWHGAGPRWHGSAHLGQPRAELVLPHLLVLAAAKEHRPRRACARARLPSPEGRRHADTAPCRCRNDGMGFRRAGFHPWQARLLACAGRRRGARGVPRRC
jgi:hypothetical protein